MKKKADAPRLRGYLPKAEGRPVIVAPRREWESLGLGVGDDVLIDVGETSLGRVGSETSVLAAQAIQYSDASGQITIYRDDPKDAPNRVNVDNYDVWINLRSHQSFKDMVNASSTTVNENMNVFLDEHVFFVKRDPDDGHRLPELPFTLKGRLTSRST